MPAALDGSRNGNNADHAKESNMKKATKKSGLPIKTAVKGGAIATNHNVQLLVA
jgi:hypothetical protein